MIHVWQDARVVLVIVVSAGLATSGAGCSGGSEEPVAPVVQPAVAAGGGTQSVAASGPEVPLASVETTEEHQTAQAAFTVLITPGSEPTAWEAAQKQLVDLGPGAIPVLLGGLASPNAIERETAATVCALTGAENVHLQTALLKCLADESSFVRANAAAALTQVPEHQPQVIATLTDLLADTDPQLRRMAAANLGSFGSEASAELPKLTAVLTDNDAEVVTPVIHLLGRIGPSAVDAVPQLQKIAFEQEGELKQAAEQALLLIRSEPADNPQPNN